MNRTKHSFKRNKIHNIENRNLVEKTLCNLINLELIFLKIPDQVGLERSRSYITSSSVSKSHSCAHGWREEQGLVKLKMNFWSMSFTSLLAIPPGRGITNHLSVYDFWLSLVYSIIYCRFSKPGGNLSPLFSFLMIFYF